MNVIETTGLGKCYGKAWALRDCTLAVPEGSLAGLRRTLLGWLNSADTAGLDEDGVAALFTSVLRDFYKGRGSAAEPDTTTGKTDKARGAEGVA